MNIPLESIAILAYVIPGFIAFYFIRKYAPIPKQYSDTECILRSLMLGFGIWALFIILIVGKIDELSVVLQPINIIWIIILTFVFAGIIVIIYKIHYKRNKLNLLNISTWDIFMQNLLSKKPPIAIVKTKTGENYGGILSFVSSNDEEKSLILDKPRRIIFKKKGVKEIPLGNSIIFATDEISTITDVSK